MRRGLDARRVVLAPAGAAAAAAQSMQRQDLEIVDCLLPPRSGRWGAHVLDAKTPDADDETECRVRGGDG